MVEDEQPATATMDQDASCDKAGWTSFLTYSWLNPLLDSGIQRQVRLDDFPNLAKAEDTAANSHQLSSRLDSKQRMGLSHPLLRAVSVTYWRQFLLIEFLQISRHFLGLLSPLLLQQVLIFQEKQNKLGVTSEEVSRGIKAVFCLMGLGLFLLVFDSQLQFFIIRVSLRINSALRGCVLQRCISQRSCADVVRGQSDPDDTVGERALAPSAYNVLSFDVGPNVDIIWIVLGLVLFPMQFAMSLTVLFRQVQWAILPGLGVILAAKLFCGVLLVYDGFLRHSQLEAKDRRLIHCSEGFANIRTLQMLAWVPPFLQGIQHAREDELGKQSRRLWLQKMVAALDYSLAAIVTLVTLGFYVQGRGGQLKASVALPVIGLVNGLIGPFGQFPVWANQYLIWRSAYLRVNEFMGLVGPDGYPAPRVAQQFPPESSVLRLSVAALDACTISWETGGNYENSGEGSCLLAGADRFLLKRVDLQVQPGELLFVTGNGGEGKTTLLHALLGELSVEAGTVWSPAVARIEQETAFSGEATLPTSRSDAKSFIDRRSTVSEVAFAAQNVILFAGTIRSNILFGANHDSTLYNQTLKACALEADLSAMPLGDSTEIGQGGATLSGGQQARVGLARAAYRAALRWRQGNAKQLVLLDEPFSALDRQVAIEVAKALFAPPSGLLQGCTVVLASAHLWWLPCLHDQESLRPRVAVVRDGSVAAIGGVSDLRELDLPEMPQFDDGDARGGFAGSSSINGPQRQSNPQDEDCLEEEPVLDKTAPQNSVLGRSLSEVGTQTTISDMQKAFDGEELVKKECREHGYVNMATYQTYFSAIGPSLLIVMFASLMGIMVLQNFCTLWIAYWTTEEKENATIQLWFRQLGLTLPTSNRDMLIVYACLVAAFTLFNFAGHAFEIIGGIKAAAKIFNQALVGTLTKPFRWWDANPTGRVLNRFSEDVKVMDEAVTNIIGVIFGAALFFVGHTFVLAIANPSTMLLLPGIIVGMEYYARFYRSTIREVQRVNLTCVSEVYQDMVEAIVGKVTIRAFDQTRDVLRKTILALEELQTASFTKSSMALWIGLRMSLLGYTLATFMQIQPILQYVGYLRPQNAAIIGFSIEYSQGVVGIIQQFIMNFSELEMQFVSIERLREYSLGGVQEERITIDSIPGSRGGLVLKDVEVTYRAGIPPALTAVNLEFAQGEATAIVGRTGAGKTSLLLAILQLVPYSGNIMVGGQRLSALHSEDVRARIVGVVPQHPVIFQGSLRYNLDPSRSASDSQLWEVLVTIGLRALVDDLQTSKQVVLSQGHQQLLCAARILLRSPRVCLLDEVTSCLRLDTAKIALRNLIGKFKDAGASVLVVTHQDDLRLCCDRVVQVSSGRIVRDEPVTELI